MQQTKRQMVPGLGPVAFWFINDEPRRALLREQLDELADKGFSAVVIHPRDGMSVPYLSRRWFELQSFLIDAAAERGLGLWFYDENPFPSGTAGGMLLNAHPELAGHTLKYEQRTAIPVEGLLRATFPKNGRMLRFYAAPVDEAGKRQCDFVDVTDWAGLVDCHWFVIGVCNHSYGPTFLPDEKSDNHWRAVADAEQWALEWAPPEDRPYLILAVEAIGQKDSRHGFYVDLLNARTTEVFIEMTHQRSLVQLGTERFGKFTAVFTDEAKLCGPYPWSDGLAADYQGSWGRDFWADLPLLLTDAGAAGETARLRYRRLLGKLWVDRYCRPIAQWCRSQGLAFTGHFSPEEDPALQALITPAWMQATAQMHWPGCDQISSRFGTLDDSHRMMGPKLACSVAHQHGREHVMVEALGVSGEGITLQQMRRKLDCLSICGCDRIVIHGQMLSMAGNRKREAPPSIFVQQPYWHFMGELSEHLSRWGKWLAQGVPVRPIAVLYPTAAFESRMPQDRQADQWALGFAQGIGRLMAAGLDFDLVSDVDLADSSMASLEDEVLIVGQARYQTLVILDPPLLEASSAKAIQAWSAKGLEVLGLGPVRLVGSDRTVQIAQILDNEQALMQRLIERHRRWLGIESGNAVYVNTRRVGHEIHRALWNPSDRPVRLKVDGTEAVIELEAAEVRFTEPRRPQIFAPPCRGFSLPWNSGWTVTAGAANTLRMQRWRVQTTDGSYKVLEVPTKSGDFGLEEKVKGPHAAMSVFPPIPSGGSVQLETAFELDGPIENLRLNWDRLAFAAEAKMWINDRPVNLAKATIGELPDSFGIPLNQWVRTGTNQIRLEIGPMWTDEAALGEPLYLCGDFHVMEISPPRIRSGGPVALDEPVDWTGIGFPHYSGMMTYAASFEYVETASNVRLQASETQRDPFEVWVNGVSVGRCCWRPWYVNLTSALRPGTNRVELIVANTLINRIEGCAQPSGLLSPPRLLKLANR